MATKQQTRTQPRRKRRATPSRPRPKPAASQGRAGAAAAGALDGHGTDAWGLALVALGLVAGLGTYLDLAGPLGRVLDAGAGGAVGLVKIVVPAGLVAAGVALLRDGRAEHDDSAEQPSPGHGAALAVGSALSLVAVTGLLHIGRGNPVFADGSKALGAAGGVLGLGVGQPLRALAGGFGAGLLLVAVALVGIVVLARTSVRAVMERTAAGMRPIHGVARRAIRGLFELGEPGAASEEQRPSVFDQDSRGEGGAPTELVGQPKRSPKAKLAAPDELGDSAQQLAIDLGPAAKPSKWKLPQLSILERAGEQEVDKKAVEQRGRVLEGALAQHGVETRLVGMVVGPSVTRYELELAPGVKVARVTSLHKDIAYAMASPDVRILAPIPGRQAIGVEVPNSERVVVALGDILSSPEAKRATHPLEVAVGRGIDGKSVLMNLATMPHILIAGATGAGKSSCLNSLLTSVLMRSTPDQVRMILVDPKRVEMGQYDRMPHLLTQVVTNPKKAANALSWAVREMERRYDLLAEVGFRDITGYNAAYDRGDLKQDAASERELPRLPFILVVIDELADLMMVAARDVEESICRIAQMARAVGIHLVIATQRPSVNVITGVIKANIPARLAFAVSSLTDSRVILDQGGAERLIGKGDMLLLGPASSAPQRIQGSWVGEEEVRKVTGAWKRQAPDLAYDDAVQGNDEGVGSSNAGSGSHGGDDDDDDLLREAMELIVRSQLGSTSMLQRKLRVGFARAGRIMDLLEQRGVVGPSTGSKARDVLMSTDELEAANTGTWPGQ
ncbi:MAG: DNA translocase FtsK [Acidimicrobiales bacterium]